MSTILAQARLRACRHWPFASHAILSMLPVPRPALGTLAVDKHWRLYFDEAALERIGTEQAAGLILHELDHLLKRHHKRGEQLVGDDNAKWDTWNHATDASINSDLRSEDIPLPDGLVYPEQFDLPPKTSWTRAAATALAVIAAGPKTSSTRPSTPQPSSCSSSVGRGFRRLRQSPCQSADDPHTRSRGGRRSPPDLATHQGRPGRRQAPRREAGCHEAGVPEPDSRSPSTRHGGVGSHGETPSRRSLCRPARLPRCTR